MRPKIKKRHKELLQISLWGFSHNRKVYQVAKNNVCKNPIKNNNKSEKNDSVMKLRKQHEPSSL